MTFTSTPVFIAYINSIVFEAEKTLSEKEYNRSLNKLSKLVDKIVDIMKIEDSYTLTLEDKQVLNSVTSKFVTLA
jgi:hypothetical protein